MSHSFGNFCCVNVVHYDWSQATAGLVYNTGSSHPSRLVAHATPTTVIDAVAVLSRDFGNLLKVLLAKAKCVIITCKNIASTSEAIQQRSWWWYSNTRTHNEHNWTNNTQTAWWSRSRKQWHWCTQVEQQSQCCGAVACDENAFEETLPRWTQQEQQ